MRCGVEWRAHRAGTARRSSRAGWGGAGWLAADATARRGVGKAGRPSRGAAAPDAVWRPGRRGGRKWHRAGRRRGAMVAPTSSGKALQQQSCCRRHRFPERRIRVGLGRTRRLAATSGGGERAAGRGEGLADYTPFIRLSRDPIKSQVLFPLARHIHSGRRIGSKLMN